MLRRTGKQKRNTENYMRKNLFGGTMKELTYFRLESCPYCRRAENYLDELMKENPEYKNIPIKPIDEDKQPEIANSFDYWYVPCFYAGSKKLHEGAATKEKIKAVLDAALV
jgi:glutaredoxin